MEKKFEVSAAWMKACGYAAEPVVFPVEKIETNMIGCKGMDAFVTVNRPSGGPWIAGPWVVAVGRGKFVE